MNRQIRTVIFLSYAIHVGLRTVIFLSYAIRRPTDGYLSKLRHT